MQFGTGRGDTVSKNNNPKSKRAQKLNRALDEYIVKDTSFKEQGFNRLMHELDPMYESFRESTSVNMKLLGSTMASKNTAKKQSSEETMTLCHH